MAAFEVIALDTATPQLRAPGASDTYTFPRAVEMPLGTANGVLFLNGSKVVTSGSGLTFDSSGNLGLGVTPSASWFASSIAMQIGSAAAPYLALFQQTTTTSDGYMAWGVRLSGDRTFAYQTTGDAVTAYRQNSGVHAWFNAPSGTAGSTISFTQAMTLDASGNLGVGVTNPAAKLEVYGGASGTVTNIQVGNASTAFQVGVDSSNNCQMRTAQNVSMLFYTNATERARIKSTGQLRFVPLAADPAGAEAGDVYYNSGTNKLRLYDGSTWVDLN